MVFIGPWMHGDKIWADWLLAVKRTSSICQGEWISTIFIHLSSAFPSRALGHRSFFLQRLESLLAVSNRSKRRRTHIRVFLGKRVHGLLAAPARFIYFFPLLPMIAHHQPMPRESRGQSKPDLLCQCGFSLADHSFVISLFHGFHLRPFLFSVFDSLSCFPIFPRNAKQCVH